MVGRPLPAQPRSRFEQLVNRRFSSAAVPRPVMEFNEITNLAGCRVTQPGSTSKVSNGPSALSEPKLDGRSASSIKQPSGTEEFQENDDFAVQILHGNKRNGILCSPPTKVALGRVSGQLPEC